MAALSTLEQKVAYLREHPLLWAQFPRVRPGARLPRARAGHEADPYAVYRRWTMIATELRRAGLVSRRVYAGDVAVPTLIAELRRTGARTRTPEPRPTD
jgi:hypothetical protein